MNSARSQGFSLVEMLTVLGVIGVLSAALTPVIRRATLQSDLTDVGAKGRDIFVAITSADAQRKLLGLGSLWPKTYWSSDAGGRDISNLTFNKSTDYFYELNDGRNVGTDNWNPYVIGFDYSKLSGAGVPAATGSGYLYSDYNMWTIAGNVRDEMDDIIPVLVTRNFNCNSLYADLLDGASNDKLEWSVSSSDYYPFANTGFVMVRKNGAVFKASARHFTVRAVYQNHPFKTTDWVNFFYPLRYLRPDCTQVPRSQ